MGLHSPGVLLSPALVDLHTTSCVYCKNPWHVYDTHVHARRLAYDGKGNAVVKSAADIDSAVESLGG
jgi:hypothetical protein